MLWWVVDLEQGVACMERKGVVFSIRSVVCFVIVIFLKLDVQW